MKSGKRPNSSLKPTTIADYRERLDRRGSVIPVGEGNLSLGEMVEQVPATILTVVAAPTGLGAPVATIRSHEPPAPLTIERGDLILAPSMNPTGAQAASMLEDAARHGAAAVAFRVADDLDRLAAAATRAQIAALVVAEEVEWEDFSGLLRSLLASSRARRPSDAPLGTEPLRNLFALADAAAANLGGLVSIHDQRMQVVAYSTLDGPADELATFSILRRKPPPWFEEWLHNSGALREVLTSEGSVSIAPPDAQPRVMQAVRAGDRVVGFVSAVTHDQGSESAIFAEAARVAALELVRLSGAENADRRLRSELLAGVLRGTVGVHQLAAKIGFEITGPGWLLVLGAPLESYPDEARMEVACHQIAEACVLRAEAQDQQATVAVETDSAAVFLLLPGELGRPLVEEMAAKMASSCARSGLAVNAAFGRLAHLAEVTVAKREAVHTLRALAGSGSTTGAWDEFNPDSVLAELKEYAADRPWLRDGPVGHLAALDAERDGGRIESLRAFLECSGDYSAAAARIHLHRNTLRYRIQRIVELTGIDLDDPKARLVAELQLRLLDDGPAEAAPALVRRASA